MFYAFLMILSNVWGKTTSLFGPEAIFLVVFFFSRFLWGTVIVFGAKPCCLLMGRLSCILEVHLLLDA